MTNSIASPQLSTSSTESRDLVWMAEVADEARQVWSHKARIVTFLSAMRHFRDQLSKRKVRVDYRQLDDSGNQGNFASELAVAVKNTARSVWF